MAVGYIFPGSTDTLYVPGKLIDNVFQIGVVLNSSEQYIPYVTQGGIITVAFPLSDVSRVDEALTSVIPGAVVGNDPYVIGDMESEGDPFPGDWSEYDLLG